MDNDKQVVAKKDTEIAQVPPVTAAVEMFLRDELAPLSKQNARSVYDLEAEYAKTKKNTSPFIPLVLLACFAAVAFGALLAVAQIRSRDSRISVSLDVFEDVNLKNLIDTVTRTQDMYEQAVKNLSSLQGSFNSRVNEAKLKLSSDMVVIESMKLSKSAAAKRKNAVTAVYNKSLSDAHAEYDEQLEAAEKEVAEYKKRLAEFDNAKVKSAQEKDKALDSERKLQNLERQKLTNNYESRIKKLEDSLTETVERASKDKKDAVLSVAEKYNAEIEELNNTIAEKDETIAANEESIASLEGQVTELTDKCTAAEAINAGMAEGMDTVLISQGLEAVVLSVSEGKVRLYVTRNRSSSIPSWGLPANITYTAQDAKKPTIITGNIAIDEDGTPVFNPSPDKNGEMPDMGVVKAGTVVTLGK